MFLALDANYGTGDFTCLCYHVDQSVPHSMISVMIVSRLGLYLIYLHQMERSFSFKVIITTGCAELHGLRIYLEPHIIIFFLSYL